MDGLLKDMAIFPCDLLGLVEDVDQCLQRFVGRLTGDAVGDEAGDDRRPDYAEHAEYRLPPRRCCQCRRCHTAMLERVPGPYDANHVGNDMTAPPPPPSRKPVRPFVIMLVAGLIVAIVSFFLMQLALNVHGFMPLVFHIVGFVLFLVWLASIVATIVGLVGTIVRIARR